MNTYSDDNGDIVMLDEHDMESFLPTEEAEADGDTSMLGMDVLDSSMSTSSSMSAEEEDDSLMLLDVDEESTMSIDLLTTDDLVVPMKRLSICIPPPPDDMSMSTSSMSGEGEDALMPDVDEESTMSIDPLTTDDLVAPMKRLSICIPPTPSDDMSISTSSVSGEGEDALMPDVDEESTMSIDPLTTDDLVVPMVRLSICIPTDVLVTSTVPLSTTREADAVMTDVTDNVTPGYQMATDHVRSMASLSTMDERREVAAKVDAAIDPTGETATAPMLLLSITNPFAADEEVDVDSVMSPTSFHFADMSSLVSAESLDYEEEFDYEDSSPSLGSDNKVDDLQSSGSSRDPDVFDLDDIPSIASDDELKWADVDAIPSPGPSGDRDEFDSDSIPPRLGSDNEFELEEVDAAGPLDVVAFPVVFVVVTLSLPINAVEEVSDAVQDQDENQGFEPNSVDDDLIEETTDTPERTKPTVPPVELRRSARIAAKSGKTVILPVGTEGSVFVNGKRRSARLSLF